MTSLIRVKRRKRNYSAPLPENPGEGNSVLLLSGLDNMLKDACFVMGVKVSDVKGKWRDPRLVDTRILYSYAATQLGYSLSSIGKYIGKHHATICHYIRKSREYLDEDAPWYRADIRAAADKILAKHVQ